MATIIDGDSGGTAVTTATQNSKGLGDSQTWQDVTGSRVFGTTYTNTTGRPIAVAASFGLNNFANYYIRIDIDGLLVTEDSGSANTDGSLKGNVFGVVPNGSTYKVYQSGGSLTGGSIWMELR